MVKLAVGKVFLLIFVHKKKILAFFRAYLTSAGVAARAGLRVSS